MNLESTARANRSGFWHDLQTTEERTLAAEWAVSSTSGASGLYLDRVERETNMEDTREKAQLAVSMMEEFDFLNADLVFSTCSSNECRGVQTPDRDPLLQSRTPIRYLYESKT